MGVFFLLLALSKFQEAQKVIDKKAGKLLSLNYLQHNQ